MAFKLSTALRRAILDTGSVTDTLNGSYIHIYAGTPPSGEGAADAEITGDLLATIYSNGGSDPGAGGLNFDLDATGAYIKKADAQAAWDNSELTPPGNVGAGTQTATHFILTPTVDGDTAKTDSDPVRILGTVGVQNADLSLSSTSLTNGEVQAINSFNISIPETL